MIKFLKKFFVVLLFIMSTICIVGCNNKDDDKGNDNDSSKNKVDVNVSSDHLFVQKVDGLTDDFILGMDISSVISLEKSGVKYYDHDGNEKDLLLILAENGINYIRVRIWNDPYDSKGNGYGGGNNDVDTAIEIGKRATKYGMKLLVNFHYSDFWADPAKQMVPKAWKDMDIETKADALYNFTKDSLKKIKDAGVDVGMVQIGNETNGKLCGENIWGQFYLLFDAGSRACREVLPNALIAVHFANPEKTTNYESYASKLNYYGIDYDVFASSYYPYWHGTLDNLSNVLSGIATKYNKKVMVAETSYAYTSQDTDFFGNTISDGGTITKNYPFTVQGQANLVRDVVDTIVHTTNGIGVFYWEGAWITVGNNSYDENFIKWEKYGSGWASSYSSEYDPSDAGKYYGGSAVDNQAFFDEHGRALESLKVWGLLKNGNNVELRADAVEDTTIICDLNGTLVLPTKVNAIMSDNSKREIDVEWHNVDFNKMYSGGVNKYTITGNAGGMTAFCYISMVEFNFLTNYSFETGDMTGWTVNQVGKADELFLEKKATDSLTGEYHYHFWSEKENSVEFYLEQEVVDLPTGNYKFSISIMGGDAGETTIYAYVKINDEIVYTAPMEITVYNSWDTGLISSFSYNAGDKLSVGIYVKCQGSGNGAWGKIDDALLNSLAE